MKTSRCFRMNRLFSAVIILAITAVLIPADADPVLSFNVGPMMSPMEFQDTTGTTNGVDDTYEFSGSESMMGMWDFSYTVTANQDPFINAQFAFQNTSMMTQQFVLAASIPITPAVGPTSLIGGSFGGSLTDANFSGGAEIKTVMGSPMYNGKIDGAGVLPIYPHATSFTANTFAGETVNIPAANVGLPGPSISGPPANSSIGIEHIFTLTPGDSVSFTSFFIVEPIPEPATLGLLGLVSGGIFFVRRFFVD